MKKLEDLMMKLNEKQFEKFINILQDEEILTKEQIGKIANK